MKITERFLWILLCILIGIVSYHFFRKIEQKNYSTEIIDGLNDELQTYKDSDSLNMAKIKIIETEDDKFFISLKTKDSTINKLQKLVDKYKNLLNNGSATILSTETSMSLGAKTIIRDTVRDTIKKYFYPTYESELNGGKWVKGRFYADKDTVLFNIRFLNEYEIIQREDKQGWFKPSIPIIEVKNLNPYSVTKELKTYKVKVPNKRFGIGPNVGIGISGKGELVPYIGIGIQYDLIKF